MATRSVVNPYYGRRRQRGMSLIELMVATGLGMTILVSVGTTFLAGQRMAGEKMNKLLLNQSIVDALKYIAEDAKRAGYNGSAGSALLLQDSQGKPVRSVIQLDEMEFDSNTDEDDEYILRYTYRTDNNYRYTSFWGDISTGRLKVCSRDLVYRAKLAACDTGEALHYESLMDDRRIRLKAFEVEETSLGEGNKTALYEVTITACIKESSDADAACKTDPDMTKTLSTTFKQRNWQ